MQLVKIMSFYQNINSDPVMLKLFDNVKLFRI